MRTIIILIIVILFFYFYGKYYNRKIKSEIERFTTLNGLNPLTSYDDYGTFNFILQTDDLPYYNPKYEKMGCCFRTTRNGKKVPCKNVMIDYDEDKFFNFEGDSIRKELIGTNYSDHREYGSSMFGNSQMLINLTNPKISSLPPEPFNWEFNEQPIKY